MEHQTFADGIGRIAVIDGIVRLDFVAHSPTETGADGKPRTVFSHRIVMGMDQFLRAADKIAETRQLILNAKSGAAPVQAAQPPVQHAQTAQPQYAQAQQPQRPGSQPQAVPPQFRRESIHPDRPVAAPQRPFP